MKQHREIISLFYKKFKCIVDQCLSHCCRGWTINIDKKTHKKYKTAHQIAIKQISNKHLIKYPNGSSTNNYSYIAMNEAGNCPFFGSDKLCGIYKTLDPKALKSYLPDSSTIKNATEWLYSTFVKFFLS
ncbi:MAG TPA: flagellin lysine-N-methylase [Arsenophonus sp.]